MTLIIADSRISPPAAEQATAIIEIARSFNIEAQISGYVEAFDKKEVIIETEYGHFEYR